MLLAPLPFCRTSLRTGALRFAPVSHLRVEGGILPAYGVMTLYFAFFVPFPHIFRRQGGRAGNAVDAGRGRKHTFRVVLWRHFDWRAGGFCGDDIAEAGSLWAGNLFHGASMPPPPAAVGCFP